MKLRISKKQTEELLANIFLIITLSMFFITRVISNSNLMLSISNVFIAIVGTVGLFWTLLNKEVYIIGYTFLLVASCIVCDLIKSGWAYGSECVFSIMFIGIAYCFYSLKLNSKLFGILFYYVCIYFLFAIIVRHSSFRNIIIGGTSHNYISVFAIFYYALYALANIKNNGEPGLIGTGILLAVCLLGYGRGGIVAALLTALLVGIYKLYVSKAKKRMYLFLLVAFGLLYFALPYVQYFLNMYDVFGKFEVRGLEDTRGNLWRAYLVLCSKNFTNFFFGVNPIELMSSGNMHNFLFQMHATFGLPFFVTTIYLIIRSATKHVKDNEVWVVIIVVCFFFRCLTDKIMFRSFGEIILYYFIFKTLKLKSRVIKTQ